MAEKEDREWHLDKRVPLALIVTVIAQTMAAAWWAAVTTTRVDYLEKQTGSVTAQTERIIRLETKMDTVVDAVADLKSIFKRTTPP
jgi:hypothetical protein